MDKKEEFKHETAGNLMSSEIPIINQNKKIKDVENILLKNKFDFVSYIYLIDNSKKLVGTISIKELFKNSKNTILKNIMKENSVYVSIHTDQERVALLALENKLKAIPVLDKEKRILGAIPSQTIFSILHAEGIEDVLHSAGIRKFKDPAKEIISASIMTHFKKRTPWLVIGLLGGILAAIIISSFEKILDSYIILAAFIPAVVYMADAIGSQSQTIFIRSMALDKELNYKNYSIKELKINVLLGIFLGLLFYLIILIGWKNSFFGIILGLSILTTVIISMGISIALPIIFNKMNFDPAISTGPFATAVRDLTSLIVYFGVASLMIYVFL